MKRPAGIEATLLFSAVLFGLDMTGANLAVGFVSDALSAPRSEVVWIVSGYVTASAAITPCTGWITGRFGSRKTFTVSLLGSALFSGLCALAPNAGCLIVFRLLQGAVGAPIYPLSLSLLVLGRDKVSQTKLVSWWGTVSFLGTISGPSVAGVLIYYGGWRASFAFIAILYAVLSAAAWIVLSDERQTQSRQLDIWGVAISCGGLVLIQIGITAALGETGRTLSFFFIILGSALLWNFVSRSLRIKSPLLNLAIFRNPEFSQSMVLVFCLGMLNFGISLLMPLMLLTLGYGPIEVGLLIVPRSISTLLGTLLAGRMPAAASERYKASAGLLVAAFGSYILYWQGNELSGSIVILAGFFQGLGSGFAATALNVRSLVFLRAEDTTDGSALRVVARTLGGATGVSAVVAGLTFYGAQAGSKLSEGTQALSAYTSVIGWSSLFALGIALVTLALPSPQAEAEGKHHEYR
jgi:DHA2 family multidrug resistance protein